MIKRWGCEPGIPVLLRGLAKRLQGYRVHVNHCTENEARVEFFVEQFSKPADESAFAIEREQQPDCHETCRPRKTEHYWRPREAQLEPARRRSGHG